ncbi:monovalent cation/H(+) antiporter subunit G [Ureibacillus acetophenoni]|uniref:Multisubunit sodium/proton antiporter MrpG subunit n=1 Tax=Ureibacillus acetophenoni TaxID=614649 RepID=A0A285UKQ0_9BACL|nr:monovalent cation/H(+) antiporter subunit G [Ureibacillus acetophenoni]SOC41186.1 multisubunit sodium/proton antiporter MrpG subunit [Ureibacillus acetophenoni]
MTILANTLVIFFISVGLLFIVVTVIGLVRLPDLYSRSHAASKSSTLGVMCILLGVFFHFWLNENHFNPGILLGVVFLFITGPVGAHIMSRSSYIAGVKPWSGTVRDDLKEEFKGKLKNKKI